MKNMLNKVLIRPIGTAILVATVFDGVVKIIQVIKGVDIRPIVTIPKNVVTKECVEQKN